jgi:predicted deacylase
VAASPIPAEELRPAPGVEVLMEELASARISGRMELVPAWSLSSSSRRSGAAGRR